MWDNEYLLGSLLLANGSVPLTVAGIMRECENNTAAYTALQLKERVDIETMVNLEEVNMDWIYSYREYEISLFFVGRFAHKCRINDVRKREGGTEIMARGRLGAVFQR